MARSGLVSLKEDAVQFAKAVVGYPGAYTKETIANKFLEIAEALSKIVDNIPSEYGRYDSSGFLRKGDRPHVQNR